MCDVCMRLIKYIHHINCIHTYLSPTVDIARPSIVRDPRGRARLMNISVTSQIITDLRYTFHDVYSPDIFKKPFIAR